MAGTFTANYGFVLQGFNDNSGTWGTIGSAGPPAEPGLNNGVFSPLDAILGGNYTQTISAGSNTLSLANWASAGIFILQTSVPLTNNATFVLPLSATPAVPGQAVGGKFIVINNTTGPYSVSVLTAASGSTGVSVPQGFAVSLYSDMTNVSYADVGLPAFAQASNGNPNGRLAGVAGSVNTNAELAWDYVNGILYVCTLTGSATGTPSPQAIWTNPVLSAQTQPELQGRLTLQSGTPVLTGDVTGASANTIYYTPYTGSWAAYHNGTSIVPFKFSEMKLLMAGGVQATSKIYDIFLAYNAGTPVIGSNQASWDVSTPGSCARGSAAISRDSASGLWINTGSISLIYNTGSGNTTIAISAGQGVYLGSIFIDSGAAGQASCYISWGGGNTSGNGGSPRKWGVWNAYNRVSILMQCGDANSTNPFNQSTGASTWAAVGASSASQSANQIQTFCGLQEEEIEANYSQYGGLGGTGLVPLFAIGVNSSTAPIGFYTPSTASFTGIYYSKYVFGPTIGVNNVIPIVSSQGGGNIKVYTGQNNCYLSTRYMG